MPMRNQSLLTQVVNRSLERGTAIVGSHDTLFERHLVPRLGRSAATTYQWLRRKGMPARKAWATALRQIRELGSDYQGGFECVPFRKAYHNQEN